MRQHTRASRAPRSIPLLPGAFAPVLSLDSLFAHDSGDGGAPFDISDDGPRPDEQLERSKAIEAVGDFVDQLSARDLEIVRRLFWQDETQAQIAAKRGVTKMAISKALARIARAGRSALADYEHLTLNC